MKLPKGVRITEVSYSFEQDADSNAPVGDLGQDLIVSTSDAGGGSYLVLKTERWAIDEDEILQFAKLLKSVVSLVPDEE